MTEPEMESLRTMGESNGDCAWAVAEIERLRAELEKANALIQNNARSIMDGLRADMDALAPDTEEEP